MARTRHKGRKMIGLHFRRNLRWTNKPRTVHTGDVAVLVFCVVAFVILFVSGAF